MSSCIVCRKHTESIVVFSYDQPDKYEKWVGIDNIARSWCRCLRCGSYFQMRNYPLSELEIIYKDGYRNAKFRGETISEAFESVMDLGDKSENAYRTSWFIENVGVRLSVLDIGSGLGIFPFGLKKMGYKVAATEENYYSQNFIKDILGIEVVAEPKDKFDVVSLIHVLEHIEHPDAFLSKLRDYVRNGIFIEVPDADEFDYLPKNHDEFNSCHCYFYNIASLSRLLERNGFGVRDSHKVKYPERNLTRLMVVADATQ